MQGAFGVYYKGVKKQKIIKNDKLVAPAVRELAVYSMYKHIGIAKCEKIEINDDELSLYLEHGIPLDKWCEIMPVKMRKAYFKMIFSNLCDALHYLHSNNVVHGDIKPSNIIILGGVAKLIDFGNTQINPTDFTDTNGTYDFVSPNAIKYGEYGPACDMYALGMTMIYYYTLKYMGFKTYDMASDYYQTNLIDPDVPDKKIIKQCLSGADAHNIFGKLTAGITQYINVPELNYILHGDDNCKNENLTSIQKHIQKYIQNHITKNKLNI